jgi:GNAT superfamily N-acetyltransferase
VQNRPLTVLVERSAAATAAGFAAALAAQDSSWHSETRPLAGGHLVLCGPGLYVNRGIAVGIDEPLTDADLDIVEQRSAAVGVPPSVEVTDVTHPGSSRSLQRRSFEHDAESDVTVCVIELEQSDVTFEDLPELERITVTDSSLEQWMDVSAEGWGHVTAAARRAADAFAHAAHVTGDRLLMAIDAGDGRPLGCASLTIAGEVATLGGMSTIPAERGRGVQSALIRHRLVAARASGCSVAVSSARTGGPSERNLMRHGFVATHTRRTYTRR